MVEILKGGGGGKMGNSNTLWYYPIELIVIADVPPHWICIYYLQYFENFVQEALRSVIIEAKWSSHVYFASNWYNCLLLGQHSVSFVRNTHLDTFALICECMSLHIGNCNNIAIFYTGVCRHNKRCAIMKKLGNSDWIPLITLTNMLAWENWLFWSLEETLRLNYGYSTLNNFKTIVV